ncbi:MAG: hypothetical protein ACRDJT_05905 [Actinomycetota bacterium]
MADPSKISLNVVPLITPDRVMPDTERGRAMRAAVVQVMSHLIVERVGPQERLPLFDAARELLEQAGRSPVEMLEAVDPGPEQDALFQELGLQRKVEE